MHIFIVKCVNSYFLSISYIKNLESDVLIDELSIFVSFRLSVKIDVVSRIVIFEHHTFKANLWIAILLLPSNHLLGNPIHTSLVVIRFESQLLDWVTKCYSSVIFSHFLG